MKRRTKRVSQSVLAANAVQSSSFEHEDHLDVKYISAYKGRGVFAKRKIEKGEFIAEYRGETVSYKEGERRLHSVSSEGSFLFFIGKNACIDASQHDGKGKMINDSVVLKKANCNLKMIKGHLCIFSVKDIESGEELLYHYGDTDSNMYWRLVMAMTQDELKLVADHMGHSLAIHTDVYRLQTSVLERTKVARALVALEEGKLTKSNSNQDTNLSTIDLDDLPVPLLQSDDDDDEEEGDQMEDKMEEELTFHNSDINEESSTVTAANT